MYSYIIVPSSPAIHPRMPPLKDYADNIVKWIHPSPQNQLEGWRWGTVSQTRMDKDLGMMREYGEPSLQRPAAKYSKPGENVVEGRNCFGLVKDKGFKILIKLYSFLVTIILIGLWLDERRVSGDPIPVIESQQEDREDKDFKEITECSHELHNCVCWG